MFQRRFSFLEEVRINSRLVSSSRMQ